MKFAKQKPVRLKGKKWRAEKEKILERDKNRCVFCGKWVGIESDPAHIVRRSQGGDDLADNLMVADRDCHNSFDNYEIGLPEKVWERMEDDHRLQYIRTRWRMQFNFEILF